jgi:hypothetical protein
MSVSARVSFGDATGRESTADLALVRVEQLVATRVRGQFVTRPRDARQIGVRRRQRERVAPGRGLPGRPRPKRLEPRQPTRQPRDA